MYLIKYTTSLLATTQSAVDVFFASDQPTTGLISDLEYWQVANGYTAIALHDIWSNTTSNRDLLVAALAQVQMDKKDCISDYNDDSMWWAMFELEMYQITSDPKYLTTAQNIWTYVNQYVVPNGKYNVNGQDMAGAVLWTNHPNEHQLNAITPGLFSELSARLSLSQDPTSGQSENYINAAINSLFWIGRYRFDAVNLVVLDHIDLDTNQTVDWKFTYNTGQVMAASIAIYRALQQHPIPSTSATLYLSLAAALARSAMTDPTWIDADGTLTERGAYPGTGSPPKTADQNDQCVGFKSVLLRSLAKLYHVLTEDDVLPDITDQLAKFIRWQYDSLQDRDTNGRGQYGPWWAGPMDLPTSHSQLAALDVLAAIHVVDR
jgi:hypothetical protein